MSEDKENKRDRGDRSDRSDRSDSNRSGGSRGSRGSDSGDSRPRRGRRRQNSYCPDGKCFDYKDIDTLRRFVTETGKIKPRRQTGNCSRCQRELAREVKRARHLALLSFVISTD
ncbi:MAG: 30S ribosomal protein S18 [Aggregatilineales bacterium]